GAGIDDERSDPGRVVSWTERWLLAAARRHPQIAAGAGQLGPELVRRIRHRVTLDVVVVQLAAAGRHPEVAARAGEVGAELVRRLVDDVALDVGVGRQELGRQTVLDVLLLVWETAHLLHRPILQRRPRSQGMQTDLVFAGTIAAGSPERHAGWHASIVIWRTPLAGPGRGCGAGSGPFRMTAAAPRPSGAACAGP